MGGGGGGWGGGDEGSVVKTETGEKSYEPKKQLLLDRKRSKSIKTRKRLCVLL